MLYYLEGLATGLVLLFIYALRMRNKFKLLLDQIESMKLRVSEQVKKVTDNLDKLKAELGKGFADDKTKYIDW